MKHFSNEEDTALIPFVSSGTECLAAKVLGRNYLGFELNTDYITIANGRLRSVTVGESDDFSDDEDRRSHV